MMRSWLDDDGRKEGASMENNGSNHGILASLARKEVTFRSPPRVDGAELFEAGDIGMPGHPRVAEAIEAVGGKLSLENIQGLIVAECRALEVFLLEKNRKYGASAFLPSRVFSQASPLEQIKVRLDDKISRLKTSGELPDEDTVKDLAGYLIILRVAQRLGLE
jgi:hypothetical protein